MNIFSLTRVNSLATLKFSNKTKTTKKTEKFSRIKSILFLILHMISNFHSIWTTNKNTVVSHRKETFIENGNKRIFFYISYFNLVHLITMHFSKDNMNTLLYINFLTLLKCGEKSLYITVKSLMLFQFSCYEKNKECFGKPDKYRKFSLALFFKFDLVFSQLKGKGGYFDQILVCIYSNFW